MNSNSAKTLFLIEANKGLITDMEMTDNNKIKVLYYADPSDIGGAEISLSLLINGIDRKQFDPLLVVTNTGRSKDFKSRILSCRTLNISKINAVFSLIKILKNERPDIVHLNMPASFSCIEAFLACKIVRPCRLIATIHSVIPATSRFPLLRGLKKMIIDSLIGIVDLFLVPSSKSKEEFCKNYDISKNKINVIYPAANIELSLIVDQAKANKVKQELGISADTFVLCTVSRLVKGKGLNLLIRAFSRILRSNPLMKLVVIGDGPLRNELVRLSKKMGVQDDVVFTGFRADAKVIVGISDIFVLPSLHESFPLSIVEAMAKGIPVIATHVGGVPEIVLDGKSGLIIDAGSEDAIVEAVYRLISDGEKRHLMGILGREIVTSNFSPDKSIDSVKSIYIKTIVYNCRK